MWHAYESLILIEYTCTYMYSYSVGLDICKFRLNLNLFDIVCMREVKALVRLSICLTTINFNILMRN